MKAPDIPREDASQNMMVSMTEGLTPLNSMISVIHARVHPALSSMRGLRRMEKETKSPDENAPKTHP